MNCTAAFFFPGSLSFEAMLSLARKHFPKVVERIEAAAPITPWPGNPEPPRPPVELLPSEAPAPAEILDGSLRAHLRGAAARLSEPEREPPWDELDPGVADVVRLLWAKRFNPTDSGDGYSKPPEARALNYPHVFCRVHVDDLISEVDRANRVLWTVPGQWTAQGSYANGEALIMCFGIELSEHELECSIDGHGRPAVRATFDSATIWVFDGAGDEDEVKGRWLVEGGTDGDDNRIEWRFHELDEALRFATHVGKAMSSLQAVLDGWETA